MKPLSYRRVAELLIEIENTGLVISKKVSRGRYGYGSDYKLEMPPGLVGPLVDQKWWDIITQKEETEKRLALLGKIYGKRRKSSRFLKNLFDDI